jgi:glycosyltransferase involved in cell wall biosynthesis
MNQSNPSISLAIITKNEADRIRFLLESAKGLVSEVVVVDSGSEDNTVQICEEFGARAIYNPWPGYARQKQFAMEQCAGDWILSLDGDEALTEELKSEIRSAVLDAPGDLIAFEIPRLSFYLGRWIRHGGWYPDRKIRLVRRESAKWLGDGVHERLEPRAPGKVGRLKNPFLHYVYRDISDQVQTINRFSTVVAEHDGKRRSVLYLSLGILHSLGKFLECWIWKLGFLDGAPGLVIAVNSSFYVFLKHAKSWERSSRQ